MVANIASCETLWLQKLIAKLTGETLEPTVVYCDNRSCIKLFETLVFHDISKLINIKCHFLRDRV
jgi:hypothetical protein